LASASYFVCLHPVVGTLAGYFLANRFCLLSLAPRIFLIFGAFLGFSTIHALS